VARAATAAPARPASPVAPVATVERHSTVAVQVATAVDSTVRLVLPSFQVLVAVAVALQRAVLQALHLQQPARLAMEEARHKHTLLVAVAVGTAVAQLIALAVAAGHHVSQVSLMVLPNLDCKQAMATCVLPTALKSHLVNLIATAI
jgi:hypothetical protein